MPSGPRLPIARPNVTLTGIGVTYESTVFPDAENARAAALSALQVLFGTRQGERLFLPDYGADLAAFMFEQADSVTQALGEDLIRQQIASYVPQLIVLDCTADDSPAAKNDGRMVWNLTLALSSDPYNTFPASLS